MAQKLRFGLILGRLAVLKKQLSLYYNIPNIHLGLGFEFGPQKNRDLSLRVLVVRVPAYGTKSLFGLVFIAFQLQDGDFALKSVFTIKLSPFMEKLGSHFLC